MKGAEVKREPLSTEYGVHKYRVSVASPLRLSRWRIIANEAYDQCAQHAYDFVGQSVKTLPVVGGEVAVIFSRVQHGLDLECGASGVCKELGEVPVTESAEPFSDVVYDGQGCIADLALKTPVSGGIEDMAELPYLVPQDASLLPRQDFLEAAE
jgi:hypothetical protein